MGEELKPCPECGSNPAEDSEMLTIAWMDGSHRSTKAHRHRIAALIEAGDRLAGFAGHDGSCASCHAGLDAPYSACDCGYTEAVKQWKEVRGE